MKTLPRIFSEAAIGVECVRYSCLAVLEAENKYGRASAEYEKFARYPEQGHWIEDFEGKHTISKPISQRRLKQAQDHRTLLLLMCAEFYRRGK